MSEKKKKISIPKYDIEGQLLFINQVCQDMEFDYKTLLTLILADWICNFQELCSKSNGRFDRVFVSYLESSRFTSEKLKKIKEFVEKMENENETENHNSSR